MILELIVLIILILVFALVIAFGRDLYQLNRNDYGTYSDEIRSPCKPIGSGDCPSQGVQTSTRFCQPNVRTGYGCIDPITSEQTYKPIVKTIPCVPNCIKSEFKEEDLTNCLSYPTSSVSEVTRWVYFPDEDIAPPEIPLALDPTQCYTHLPNAYKRVERTCTVVNPSGETNNCRFYDPRRATWKTVKEGFRYQVFVPCFDPPNLECGSWVPCPSYNQLMPSEFCLTEAPGQLFAERVIFTGSVCQADPSVPCNLQDRSDSCIFYPEKSKPSRNCDRTPYTDNKNVEVCTSYTHSEITNFLIGNNRKAFLPMSLIGMPISVTDVTVPLVSTGCPQKGTLWENNPFCIQFCRNLIDTIKYGDPEPGRDSVKNRSGFILTVNSKFGYLGNSSLPDQDTLTPLDFVEIEHLLVVSTSKCSTAEIIQTNALIVALIPTDKSNTYKLAGLLKADMFGWIVSGETLKTFFPDSAKKYFQGEIDLITEQMKNTQDLSLEVVKEHLQRNLADWDQTVGRIKSDSFYWVPARVNLTRPSHAIAPVQSQADTFQIKLTSFNLSPDMMEDLPMMVRAGSSPESRTYLIKSFINTKTKRSFLDSSRRYILSLTVEFSQYGQTFILDGQKITIRDLFITRGSNEVPNPPCIV